MRAGVGGKRGSSERSAYGMVILVSLGLVERSLMTKIHDYATMVAWTQICYNSNTLMTLHNSFTIA